eukprot:TRINITY_DN1215_c0_g1_i1.p2 TRINITY_DN1215_c0_g1~~TRINITY_DN1215_c0_g1_i1.p2  ORF type:complete len:235 (-),score=84.08 TRINITY_DN1215_c0_g1_i1:225-929(-)
MCLTFLSLLSLPLVLLPLLLTLKGETRSSSCPAQNLLLTPAEVRKEEKIIKKAKVLVCQLEISLETTLEALKIAKEGEGTITVFNPAPAPLSPLPPLFFSLSDYICPNETEAEVLTGVKVSDIKSAEEAAKKLLEKGAKNVLMTLGSNGALLVNSNHSTHIPTEKVQAVDTTGAGDCFLGSFAFFLASGNSVEESIKKANLIASISVQSHGTQTSFPDRAQLLQSTLGLKNLFA